MNDPAPPTARAVDRAVQAEDGPARPGRWTSLTGATTAQVGISYLEQGVAALVPYLKADLGLSSSVAGLFGVSVNIGRALAATLSIGPVDRFGERRLMLVGGFVSGGFAMLAAIATHPPVVLVLLLASGVAQTVAILAGITAVAAWFRQGRRGIAMGIRQAAVPVGGTLAAASIPLLALELGWRYALLVAGATSIAASTAGTLIYRDHAQPRLARPPRAARRGAIRAAVRDRDVSRAALAGAVLAAGQFVTLTYIQLFLVEDLQTSLRFAALALVLTQVAGIAGRIAWGLASDLAFGGRRKGVLVAILVLAAGASAGMGLAGEMASVALAIPMAVLLGLTTVGSPGIYLALIADLTPPGSGATTMGVGLAVIQGSALVVPPLFGTLADASASYQLGWFALAGLFLATVPVLRSVRPS